MCYEAKRWNQTIPHARGGKFRWIEQTTRPSPAATHFSYRGGNIEISIQTQLENHTCKKKDKDNYLILKKKCCIPLSISFIDTGSFFSVLETWKFPGRCIVATFWEILISNQQRKGKGRREGIGGVQRGGGGTNDQYHGTVPDHKTPRLFSPFQPTVHFYLPVWHVF